MSTASTAEEPRTTVFRLGDWRVEPGLDRIVRLADATEVQLEPRAMDLLVALADRAGETVAKETLLHEVWRDAHVVESVVPKTVSILRGALGDRVDGPSYILTVPRRGYRLIADVERQVDTGPGDDRRGSGARDESAPLSSSSDRPRPSRPATLWAVAAVAGLVSVAVTLGAKVGLDRAPSAANPARIQRLGVAPFSESAGDTRLGTALRAELLSDLSRLEVPVVVPLAPQDGGEEDPLATGREEDADAVLRGSVFDLGDRVRIELRLTDTRTGFESWSMNVERRAEDLWMLRTEVASSLLQRLGGRIAPVDPAADMPPDVYRTYLEARFLWSRRSVDGLTRARDLFEYVTRGAPDFAEGFAWLAVANLTRANYVLAGSRSLSDSAVSAAERAVRLAPQQAMSRLAAGLVALNVRTDPATAVAEYRVAIKAAPNSAMAHQFLAEAFSASGDHASALSAADAAVALDPLSPVHHAVRGLVLYAAERWQEAVDSLDRALVLDPEFRWTLRYRAFAHWRLGQADAAYDDLVRMASPTYLQPGPDELRLRMEAEGLRGFFVWRLQSYEDGLSKGHTVRPMGMAEALAGAGRQAEALEFLEKASRAGQGEYFFHWRTSPAFDALRQEPRFRALYDSGR